ncbi:WD40/YVTN/BNR-like repeat-containing protein [Saccharibacillus alkalitolerans]|uniref:Exo-alpha-sialidase n=1 Tax=Saccharibacillus alkalitolerans TaxID=2705290 RepID=A0ABX0F120_9BACL|nr:sialidase family protein [Saccharibacillus alkalitolerans]NGZ74677.1 exo-alpha-sialidase [Saccharibacillus alkalitolerans]
MKQFLLGMQDRLMIVRPSSEGRIVSYRLHGTQPLALAADPYASDRLYCATYGSGLWKSEDGGDSWSAIGKPGLYHERNTEKGMRSAQITALAVHPTRKGWVYAGTEPSALYVSRDYGEHWSEFRGIQELPSKPHWQFPPRPYTSHVRWITPSYAKEERIGVSIEAGAFLNTSDDGEHWNDRSSASPLDTHTLLAHPKAPGRLYAACGDGLFAKEHAYAESHDEGRTWTFKSEGLERHPYLYGMTLHPADPEIRLVSAAESASAAHHSSLYSTLYRKTGEYPWQEIGEGLPREGAFIAVLAADPVEKGVFYALNNFGLYRLPSGQDRWERLEIAWDTAFEKQHPGCLWVGDYDSAEE